MDIQSLDKTAAAVKPMSEARMKTVAADVKVRDLVDKMVDRTYRAARFDLEIASHHDAAALFSFAGSNALMFALQELYDAMQNELREEDRNGC